MLPCHSDLLLFFSNCFPPWFLYRPAPFPFCLGGSTLKLVTCCWPWVSSKCTWSIAISSIWWCLSSFSAMWVDTDRRWQNMPSLGCSKTYGLTNDYWQLFCDAWGQQSHFKTIQKNGFHTDLSWKFSISSICIVTSRQVLAYKRQFVLFYILHASTSSSELPVVMPMLPR